jgi:hypothetical protein
MSVEMTKRFGRRRFTIRVSPAQLADRLLHVDRQAFRRRWAGWGSTRARTIFDQNIPGRKSRVRYRHGGAGGTAQHRDLSLQLLRERPDDAGAKAGLFLP